jgi:hypothetical protein
MNDWQHCAWRWACLSRMNLSFSWRVCFIWKYIFGQICKPFQFIGKAFDRGASPFLMLQCGVLS